jgi:hypothetical protein
MQCFLQAAPSPSRDIHAARPPGESFRSPPPEGIFCGWIESEVHMRAANKVITIILAIAAAAAWLITSVFPTQIVISYPDVQVPMAITLSAAACLGWVLLYLTQRRGDNETRCRKCGYILRGISEPRCPECGERI